MHEHYDDLKDLQLQGQNALLTILTKERELTHQYYQTQLWQQALELKKAQSARRSGQKRSCSFWLDEAHTHKKLRPNQEVCQAMQLLTE